MRKFCDAIIQWSFYALLLLIPLIFFGDTSELFEFNKIWLTFILSIIIGAAWITKMVSEKKIIFRRTFFDIPLLLFLLANIISTIFSMDSHISLWGYYSRFNGGLLSIFSYVLLFYAFVSNMSGKKNIVHSMLFVGIISGVLVSVWGLPSHFGYDPTCLIFRGTLDVSCWTDAFHPTLRMFSTLGQPDWLSAYIAIIIPISIAFGWKALKEKSSIKSILYLFFTFIFLLDLLFARSRGGYIGLVGGLLSVTLVGLWSEHKKIFSSFGKYFKQYNYFFTVVLIFLLTSFFIGTSLNQIDRFTFPQISTYFVKPSTKVVAKPTATPQPAGELAGTDSGTIRLYVWEGALAIWKHNPLFGTGVETFAYAYYQYRPVGHNLTSEWDYLYNKAHNEYLNYLATVGLAGTLPYLVFILLFLVYCFKVFRQTDTRSLVLCLLASFLTICISNFFGFSVVIVDIYFFLIPAFVFLLTSPLQEIEKEQQIKLKAPSQQISTGQKLCITGTWVVALYLIGVLINYWFADRAYGLGNNYDKAGYPKLGTSYLESAVSMRPGEPVYKDELSINLAQLAIDAATQKDSSSAASFMQQALQLSDDVTMNYPNDISYWKTRVRVLYTLSQLNPQLLPLALTAIQKAQMLGPTDPKVAYNLGLLYQQLGDPDKAVAALKHTIVLKSNYREAYYALGLILHQQAVDKNNKVVDQEKEQEAVAALKMILTKIRADDGPTIDLLKSWKEM